VGACRGLRAAGVCDLRLAFASLTGPMPHGAGLARKAKPDKFTPKLRRIVASLPPAAVEMAAIGTEDSDALGMTP
jgi:hypothetical protein